MLKNLRMAAKLALSFGLLLFLTVLLGLYAISVMRDAARDARVIARAEVPAIETASEIANQATSTVADMRGYYYDFDEQYLLRAVESLNDAQRAAVTFLEEQDASGELDARVAEDTRLGELFRSTLPLLERYGQLMQETSASVTRMLSNRAALERLGDRVVVELDERITSLTQALAANAAVSPERLNELQSLVRQLWQVRLGLQRANFTRQSAYFEQQLERLSQLQSRLRALAPGGDAAVTLEEETVTELNEYVQQARQYVANWNELNDVTSTRVEAGDAVLEAVDEVLDAGATAARQSAEETVESLERVTVGIALGLLASVIVGLIAAVYLARSITRPLAEGVEFARGVAAGDFTRTLNVDRGDEVGDLARALNATVFALRDQTRAIGEGVNVLGASVSEIVTSTSQLSASAAETAASISQTTATVEEVKQTSVLTNERAQGVSQASQQTVEGAQAGEHAAGQVNAGMNRIREQMTAITQSISRLSEQSRAIGEIISSVDDLAEQSSILAVNAAIEAAKAGEHGRGFSVVAQEIRALAEQSKRATSQVRSLLNQIQEGTRAAVGTVDQGARAVDAGVEQSSIAREAIQTLYGGINEAAEATTQIAAMSQQQAAGMDQVAVAMENIKQASMQTADSMRQLESAAHSLNDLGERLKELVKRFKVQ